MNSDWIFILVLLLSFVYALCGKSYIFAGLDLFRRNVSNSNDNLQLSYLSVQYMLLFVAVFSCFLFEYCLILYYDIDTFFDSYWKLFWLLLSNFFLFGIRNIIITIVRLLSRETKLFKEYRQYVLNSYQLIAFIVFIASILFLYANLIPDKYLIYTAIIGGSITLFLRYFKLFSLFTQTNISTVYFILYLCGLEILPLLVLFHAVLKIV